MRLPYTFAIAKFGGRNWTVVSAALLLVPATLAIFVLEPGVSAAGAERPIYYVWLGALAGSFIRPIGGWLADKHKGSTVSLWNFVAMAVAAIVVAFAADSGSIPVLATSFTVLFMLTGLGNGSVYKMIPAIFHAESLRGGEGSGSRTAQQDRRLASALVGLAGAVGAFGGVLVQVAFRHSFLSYGDESAAYLAFVVFYIACSIVTWAVYLRPSSSRLTGV